MYIYSLPINGKYVDLTLPIYTLERYKNEHFNYMIIFKIENNIYLNK